MNDEELLKSAVTLSREFARLGIKEPIIVIEDRATGFELEARFRQVSQYNWRAQLGPDSAGPGVITADGRAWHEFRVNGVRIRWPAEKRLLPTGASAWV